MHITFIKKKKKLLIKLFSYYFYSKNACSHNFHLSAVCKYAYISWWHFYIFIKFNYLKKLAWRKCFIPNCYYMRWNTNACNWIFTKSFIFNYLQFWILLNFYFLSILQSSNALFPIFLTWDGMQNAFNNWTIERIFFNYYKFRIYWKFYMMKTCKIVKSMFINMCYLWRNIYFLNKWHW